VNSQPEDRYPSRDESGEIPASAAAEPAQRGFGPKEFDAFYREHFSFVWRTLRRLGVHGAAIDDAVQDVFMVVHRKLPAFEPRASAKTWLYSIAVRVASDQRRSIRRKGNLVPLVEAGGSAREQSNEGLHAEGGTPLESAMQSQANDLMLAFLESLDHARRTVFILVVLEQMSAPEVARATTTNLNTVYYRVASARKEFAEFVKAARRRAMETKS
jgi:RNA polymerase sigma-70 factor (ECF subfamily)